MDIFYKPIALPYAWKMALVKQCVFCGERFKTKPYFVKKGQGKYCSSECQHKAARKGKEVACFLCKNIVYRQPKLLLKSKSKKFFCSKSCQTKWRNQLYVGEKHKNWKTGLHAYRSVLPRHGIPAVCTLCKTTDKRVLAVHHVDHNRKNNNVDNLAWLCHNCHHLVHCYQHEHDKLMVAIV